MGPAARRKPATQAAETSAAPTHPRKAAGAPGRRHGSSRAWGGLWVPGRAKGYFREREPEEAPPPRSWYLPPAKGRHECAGADGSGRKQWSRTAFSAGSRALFWP